MCRQLSVSVTCRICELIAATDKGFKPRMAFFQKETHWPRCHWHWRFQCDSCKGHFPFHAVAWCEKTKHFTCILCATEHHRNMDHFWAWEYSYRVRCQHCKGLHHALDRLENLRKHPWRRVPGWLKEHHGGVRADRFHAPFRTWTGDPAKVTADRFPRSWEGAAQWYLKEPRDLTMSELADPWMRTAIGDPRGLQILEIGCGTGTLARELAQRGGDIEALDVAPSIIEVAEREEEKIGSGARFRVADASDLGDFEEDGFDLAIAHDVLPACHDLGKVLAEVRRVLNPSGRFLATLPHPAYSVPAPGEWVAEPPDSMRNEERTSLHISRPAHEQVIHAGPPKRTAILTMYRPVGTYITGLHAAGLILTRKETPFPNADQVRAHPYQLWRVAEDFPTWLCLEAVKPSG